ncbi:hypothetical protein ACTFIZ_006655 [Dictyostelium cf. discoideum]
MKINKFILIFFISFFIISSCFSSPIKWKKSKYKNNEKNEIFVENQIKQMKLIVNSDEFKNGNYNNNNSSMVKFSNQVQLFENDKILAFFLDQIRDYFSEIGFDPITLESYIKTLCDTLLICRIPILGDAINLTVDIVGILLEAQCYRDRILNTPVMGSLTTSPTKSPLSSQKQ